jgi:DNA adenine methylase
MSKYKKPLFMWAGGKTKMIKFYDQSRIMPTTVNRYIEPFFGGGAMYIEVMERFNPKISIINDINSSIVKIYQSIKTDYDNFIIHLDRLCVKYLSLNTVDRKTFYYEVRNLHAYHYQNWSTTQESATLYFLMKTGFNGIWQCNQNTNGRFGTPSGLLNQKDRVYDVDVIKYWNNILQSSIILNQDCKSVLSQYPDVDDSFYFLDPPYRGSFTHYSQTFTDQDQTDLLTFAKSVSSNSRILLCNDDVGDNFFQNQIGSLQIESYNLKHTAGRRKKTDDGFIAKSVTEIVIHNSSNIKSTSESFGNDLFEIGA